MGFVLDEVAFRCLASNLGKEWKALATHLGVRKDEVDRIEADNQRAEERIFQMLMAWWQRCDHGEDNKSHAPSNVLQNGLVKSGRSDLAETLRSSK